MRIVLLGDIHHYRLMVPPWQLLGKRLLGQANLWLNRRHSFDPSLLNPVIDRIADVAPDLILLSGDLTTTALRTEFADIAEQLAPLTDRFQTVIVPGNHDRYTFSATRSRLMEQMLPGHVPTEWPHHRQLTDRWHLLAINSAVPRIANSRGRIGREQLTGIRRVCSRLTDQDALVVLCHYPVKAPPRSLPLTWDHKLADSRQLRHILTRCPARLLYLHGHIHKPWCWQPKGSNQSHFTYINAGSPCQTSKKHPLGQGFWQIDLPPQAYDTLAVTHHVPSGNRHTKPADHQWITRSLPRTNVSTTGIVRDAAPPG